MSEKAMTWAELAASVLRMTESEQLEPAVYVEPYDEPEAVALTEVVKAVEDIWIDDDEGEDTVHLIQVQFFTEDEPYGHESYWCAATTVESATQRALELSDNSRFADARIDFTRRTLPMRQKDKVRVVVRAGGHMLR